MVRTGFTLIELIFAIVIISIAVISLPTMNQSTTAGIEGNMVQEAIFAASTELNQVVSANWDDRSVELGFPSSMARVIQINNGITDCNTNTTSARYRRRPGHIIQPLHRRCLDSSTLAPFDGNTSVVIGLDEMEYNGDNLFDDTDTDAEGYKSRYTATIAVDRNVSFNGINPNMKSIAITVRDADGRIVTSLTTYSANIGEVDYYKRSY